MNARFHTRIVIDMATGLVEEDDYELYSGEWALLKESSAEKARRQQTEQLQFKAASDYYNVDLPWQRSMAQKQFDTYNATSAAERALQKQGLDMQKQQFDQQMALMKESLARQYAWLDPIKAQMEPYLKGDAYGSADVKAAQDAVMSDTIRGYDTAGGQVRAALLARGGDNLPVGGDYARGISELESGLANATAAGRRQTTLDYKDRNMATRFNAASVLMGGGSQFGSNVGIGSGGAGAAASGFTSGAKGYATPPTIGPPGVPAMLAPPKPQGFWAGLGGKLLGGAANIGLGFATGGLSNMFSSWFKPQQPAYGGGGGGYGGGGIGY